MVKVVTLVVAALLIGFIAVGMYAYTQTANLDKWGTYKPLMELAPGLFIAACGVGGILVYAFIRRH
jgi:uncharacterized membrane protein